VAELEEDLETSTAAFGEKIRDLQNQVTILQRENEAEEERLIKELEGVRAEKKSAEDDVTELKRHLDELTEEIRELRENSSQAEELEEVQGELKHSKAELADFRQKYDRLSDMCEAQDKVIDELKRAAPKPTVDNSQDLENLRNQNTKVTLPKRLWVGHPRSHCLFSFFRRV